MIALLLYKNWCSVGCWLSQQLFHLVDRLQSCLKNNDVQLKKKGVNSILIIILRFWPISSIDRTFCFVEFFPFVKRIILKKVSKTDLPFRFCKIGIRNLFLAEKMVVCSFVLLQRPILAYFKKITALIELRKILLRKQLFDVRLLTPKH